MAAPLSGAEQATRLAGIIARTGLEPWDAHVASVADASVCPILTLDAALWRAHANDLDERSTSSRSPTRTRRQCYAHPALDAHDKVKES